MELDLDDTRGPYPGVEDVLGGGDVPVLTQPRHVVQEVLGAVGQLVLVGPQEGRLHPTVLPQSRHDLGEPENDVQQMCHPYHL